MTKPRSPRKNARRPSARRIDPSVPGIDLDHILRRMAEIEDAFPDLDLPPVVLSEPNVH